MMSENLNPLPDIEFAVSPFFPEQGGLDDSLPAEKHPVYLQASKRYLEQYRAEIREAHRNGASGEWVVRNTTRMFDLLIEKLFRSISSDALVPSGLDQWICLVAVGGYGRGELNPYSDIDLMFLYSGKEQQRIEGFAQKLLYLLWDMKLDVGYSVRTTPDCIEMAKADLTIKTALLDCRYLVGNAELYAELEKVLERQILVRESDSFIRQKVDELAKRRKKYGSSIYTLEPNIKEGEGGLRDLHSAMWVAKIKYKVRNPRELIIKGVLTEDELAEYYSSLSCLWRIRNELHFLAGRKKDQLTFDAQTAVAAFLGYQSRTANDAEEAFMQDYYLHSARVEHFSSLLIAKCAQQEERTGRILGYFTRRPIGEGFFVLKGELVIPVEDIFEKDPSRLMKVFEYAQKQGVALGLKVKTLIRNSLHLVNDKFRRNREVNQSFFAILRHEKGVIATLRLMHHLKFLNCYIPEFERIYCKVQHDLYHIYTVDIHTLFCAEELVALWLNERSRELPLLTRLARGIEKRETLLLAVLLHDIGKGEGNRHAERGAEMIPTIARRMGLSREDTERIEFLVRNHLTFAHIAQRRDLNDERMIIDFARQMVTSENLSQLYLLTYADIRGVGPDVWTEWKANLLQELYEKSFAILERGNFRLEAHTERVRKVKREVVEALSYDLPSSDIKDELKAMPIRHLLNTPQTILARHVTLLSSLSIEQPLRVIHEHMPESGYTMVTICTYDVPGLFSNITGVMAAHSMNILGAQINSCSNGKVLDLLQVNSSVGQLVTDENRWKRFEADLGLALTGRLNVAELVKKRRGSKGLVEKPKPRSRYQTRIEIDNEVSEEYTVIDIYADDKIGLLYQITAALSNLGLYIGVAKISTKADQVADVFYVKDIFSHKIKSDEKLQAILLNVKQAIDTDA